MSSFIKTAKVRTRGLRRGRGLRDVMWEGDTVAATFFIGANKGKEPRNREGFCRTQPKAYKQAEIDNTVQGIRAALLIDRGMDPEKARTAIGGSRVAQKGWYRGDAERSSAFTIFFDPDVPGEETPEKFQKSMVRLAEYVGGALCQDSVILAFKTPGGDKSFGIQDNDAQRREAVALKRLVKKTNPLKKR